MKMCINESLNFRPLLRPGPGAFRSKAKPVEYLKTLHEHSSECPLDLALLCILVAPCTIHKVAGQPWVSVGCTRPLTPISNPTHAEIYPHPKDEAVPNPREQWDVQLGRQSSMSYVPS